MERLAVNLIGGVRRAKLGGRDYLVAPLTLIVPGVLNGSQGPLYYPLDELRRSAEAWNGIPLVVGHPQTSSGYVSARAPDVLDKQAVGVLLNAKANGKLTGEGWFEVEALRRIRPGLLSQIEQGQKVELSTGLFTDNEPAENGSFEGKPYTHVARNYRPDHLAVLPDSQGACSLAEGCGVNVNEGQAKQVWNRFLSLLGITVNPKGQWEPPEAGDAPQEVKDILREVYGKWRDKHPAENPAVKAKGAKIAWGAVARAGWSKTTEGKWIKKKPTANVIRQLPSGKWRLYSSDGKKNLGTFDTEDDAKKHEREVQYFKRNSEANQMTEQEKKAVVDFLIANCGACGEADRKTLNELPDEALTKWRDGLKAGKEAHAAATKGFSDPTGATHAWNEKAGKWETNPKEPVANEDKTKDKPKTLDDWLKDAPQEAKEVLINARQITEREKRELAERLAANVKDEEAREQQVQRLMKRSLDDLRADADLVPEAPKLDPIWIGSPTGNTRPKLTPMGLPSEYLPPARATA